MTRTGKAPALAQSEQQPSTRKRQHGDSGHGTDALIPLTFVPASSPGRREISHDVAPAHPQLASSVDLPEQPSALVGRDHLVETSVAQLVRSETRLMTLVGPGGVGKTRLACEIARQAAPHYDLVRFIDLMPLNGDLIAATISNSCSGARRPGNLPEESPRILLFLDNFEHVLDVGPQIAQILTATRDLDIIATSRERLRLRWEHLVLVPPLTFPNSNSHLPVTELAGFPAVALFVSQIQRLRPGFELTKTNTEIVSDICRRLHGLPLALELAASKLQVFSLSQLHDQLEHILDVLDRGPRDLPGRQRSLRATIDWSYQLLSPLEQLVARQAAVFAGGASIEAADAVIQLPAATESVLDVLIALAEKSILTLDTANEAAPRFTMLTTTQEYLLEKLAADDEKARLEARCGEYYRALAERFGESTDASEIQILDQERENFRSVFQAAIDQRISATVLRLALSLTKYWRRTEQLAEARRWLEPLALQSDSFESLDQQFEARVWAGRFALFAGDLKSASQHLDVALDLSRVISSSTLETETLLELAHVYLARGDAPAAEDLGAQALILLDGDPDTIQDAHIRYLQGSIAGIHGRHDEARLLLADARQLFSAAGADQQALQTTLKLADLDLIEGALGSAKRRYADTVEGASGVPDRRLEIAGRIGLGIVARQQEHEESTLSNLRAAFEIAERSGDEFGVALAIDALALLGLSRARLIPEWLQLAGYAEAALDRLGIAATALERQRTSTMRQAASEILGNAEFERLEMGGRRLTLTHIREMLDEAQPGRVMVCNLGGVAGDVAGLELLTRREREVVQYIAQGMTNRQIAVELDIAERTVDSHVGNLLRKLNLGSRARAAAWAVEHGLAKL